MKTLMLILLISLATRTHSQTESDETEMNLPSELAGEFPELLDHPSAQDSLYRMLARLEIARATERVSATGLFRRLIPRMQIGATCGVRELVFPETAGALILPRDSYRLTLSLSLSDLLDGSQHALARLELGKASIRYGLLLATQARASREAERKKFALEADLAQLRKELQITVLLVRYQEYQFQQGKTESPALARIRLEELRLKGRILRLERELDRSSVSSE